MQRIARVAPGGIVYHVLNRGNGRQTIFRKDADAAAFLDLLAEVKRRVPMRVLGYCLMGNHWHLALWPPRGRRRRPVPLHGPPDHDAGEAEKGVTSDFP